MTTHGELQTFMGIVCSECHGAIREGIPHRHGPQHPLAALTEGHNTTPPTSPRGAFVAVDIGHMTYVYDGEGTLIPTNSCSCTQHPPDVVATAVNTATRGTNTTPVTRSYHQPHDGDPHDGDPQ